MTQRQISPFAAVLRTLLLLMFVGTAASASAVSLTLAYVGDNEITADGTILAAHGDELLFEIVADFRDHPTIGGVTTSRLMRPAWNF